MPSERGPVAWLGSVRLSLVTGFGTSALLLAASFFLPNPRGPDALPFSESIRGFFPPRAEYAWFYLLLGWTALYGLNGLFGTWRTWRLRRASGGVDRRFVAILLMHLGFLGGLGAHLVAGFGSAVEERATLSSTPTQLAGRTVRITDAEATENPDGSLRGYTARLDLGDGDVRRIGYDDPVFLDGLRRWILVERPTDSGDAPRFSVDGAVLAPGADGSVDSGGVRWKVLRVSHDASLRAPMVLLQRADGAEPAAWLAPGMRTSTGLAYLGLVDEPGLDVVVRRNDGLPLVALASLVFSLGLVLYAADARRR